MAEEGSPVLSVIKTDQVNLVTSVLEHVLEQHMNRLTALERLISGDIKFVYAFWKSILLPEGQCAIKRQLYSRSFTYISELMVRTRCSTY